MSNFKKRMAAGIVLAGIIGAASYCLYKKKNEDWQADPDFDDADWAWMDEAQPPAERADKANGHNLMEYKEHLTTAGPFTRSLKLVAADTEDEIFVLCEEGREDFYRNACSRAHVETYRNGKGLESMYRYVEERAPFLRLWIFIDPLDMLSDEELAVFRHELHMFRPKNCILTATVRDVCGFCGKEDGRAICVECAD